MATARNAPEAVLRSGYPFYISLLERASAANWHDVWYDNSVSPGGTATPILTTARLAAALQLLEAEAANEKRAHSVALLSARRAFADQVAQIELERREEKAQLGGDDVTEEDLFGAEEEEEATATGSPSLFEDPGSPSLQW